MTLADAQKLAIRKLLSKSAYDSNVAPGPPLPRSHPSPALLAKLHLECASLYNSARTLAKTPGASGGPAGDVTTDLRKYLSEEAIFHNAMGKKWLGVDGGENGGSEKGGEALGFITWARKDLEDMGKGLSLSKGEKNIRKERIVQEAEALLVWQNHYKKFNDTVRLSSSASFSLSLTTYGRFISSQFLHRQIYSLVSQQEGWLSQPNLTFHPSQLSALTPRKLYEDERKILLSIQKKMVTAVLSSRWGATQELALISDQRAIVMPLCNGKPRKNVM